MSEELDEKVKEMLIEASTAEEIGMGIVFFLDLRIAVPFEARVVGVPVRVVEIEARWITDYAVPVAVCVRDGEQYEVDILDLEEWEHASGAVWIATYRRWVGCEPWPSRRVPVEERVSKIEGDVRRQLSHGIFVPWNEVSGFVAELEPAVREIQSLENQGYPSEATQLYEFFVEQCRRKYGEVHDEVEFHWFIQGLVWSREICRSKVEEADAVARHVAEVFEDDFLLLDAAKLDRMSDTILDALERLIADRLRQLNESDEGELTWSPQSRSEARRRYPEVLKEISRIRADSDAFADLLEQLGPTVDDCQTVAEIKAEEGELEAALEWTQRGIRLDASSGRSSFARDKLDHLRLQLLQDLERCEEAVEEAWKSFRRSSNASQYKTLLDVVPVEERDSWRERALDTMLAGGMSWAYLRICSDEGDVDRLASFVAEHSREKLQQINHKVAEPVAKALEDEQPALAAKVYAAQGLRIVDAGKSKYYDEAVDYFSGARRLWMAVGNEEAWEQFIERVDDEHSRKYKLMKLLRKMELT